ncbi:substrate-binding periplasmic protein [Pseudoalteromonas phenolica]|uniref:substrate-binding periplasmic protein n=1 Tax=Pseudoalteromonas phenolica TaxID=161398 RepID=UPI000FFF22C7|nr:transporter substrate-binding domain-containing protein [Pseudoalteromonas phenolica]RXE94697.1 hypothetical protein D9981_18600 [Pseudoalteromonas phenolica O-BC30]
MKSWIIALCLNACFCFSACAEQTVRITSGADPYVIALLNHTLSYQNEVHTLDFVKNIPTQNRAIRLLGAENGIDVFWSVTSDEREKQALAVRIPIVKGVLGYRLGVIKKSRLEFFTKLRSDGELKKLRYGLRTDWPDTVIFKDNDFNVLEYSQENSGYDLLEASRIDVLPIDALFANDIANMSDLTIDPAHVFYYPSAVYFFVDKNNKTLYQKLKVGLDKSIEDGSFDTLFNRHFENELAELALDKRQKNYSGKYFTSRQCTYSYNKILV